MEGSVLLLITCLALSSMGLCVRYGIYPYEKRSMGMM